MTEELPRSPVSAAQHPKLSRAGILHVQKKKGVVNNKILNVQMNDKMVFSVQFARVVNTEAMAYVTGESQHSISIQC